MEKTIIRNTLINFYNETSATHNYIVAFNFKGNLIAVNSGRPMKSVMDTMKEQKLDIFEGSFAIAFDGAWIKDVHSGKDIVKKTVEMRDVYAASKVLQDAGIHVHAYSDDSIITCADDEEIHFIGFEEPLEQNDGEVADERRDHHTDDDRQDLDR